MTTRRFWFLDEDLTTPPDPTGLAENTVVITNDGVVHVLKSGSWTVTDAPVMPIDTTLPDPTGVPNGSVFVLDNGDGTSSLYVMQAGTWEPLTRQFPFNTGTALPGTTGLPNGTAFMKNNGDGTASLYGILGGSWKNLTGAAGGGGGGGGGGGILRVPYLPIDETLAGLVFTPQTFVLPTKERDGVTTSTGDAWDSSYEGWGGWAGSSFSGWKVRVFEGVGFTGQPAGYSPARALPASDRAWSRIGPLRPGGPQAQPVNVFSLNHVDEDDGTATAYRCDVAYRRPSVADGGINWGSGGSHPTSGETDAPFFSVIASHRRNDGRYWAASQYGSYGSDGVTPLAGSNYGPDGLAEDIELTMMSASSVGSAGDDFYYATPIYTDFGSTSVGGDNDWKVGSFSVPGMLENLQFTVQTTERFRDYNDYTDTGAFPDGPPAAFQIASVRMTPLLPGTEGILYIEDSGAMWVYDKSADDSLGGITAQGWYMIQPPHRLWRGWKYDEPTYDLTEDGGFYGDQSRARVSVQLTATVPISTSGDQTTHMKVFGYSADTATMPLPVGHAFASRWAVPTSFTTSVSAAMTGDYDGTSTQSQLTVSINRIQPDGTTTSYGALDGMVILDGDSVDTGDPNPTYEHSGLFVDPANPIARLDEGDRLEFILNVPSGSNTATSELCLTLFFGPPKIQGFG